MKSIEQAVILAGGQGIRLRPLTVTTPKPMILIHGKSFLAYIIELLKANGITQVVLLVGYLHEQIEDYFGDGKRFGITIKYSHSPVEADTGTRLRVARPLLKQTFLLLYGDNYWPLKIDRLTDYYKKLGTKALITIYSNRDNTTKNNISVGSDGLVYVYDKSRTKKDLNGVDIGFFLLDRNILKNMPEYNFSFEDIIIPRLIKEKQLAGFLTHHKYYGLSTPERIPVIKDYFSFKKVLFLDRDGVINKRPPKGEYVTDWKQFSYLPRAKEALMLAQKKGYETYIMSNQAGIARGKITKRQVDAIGNRFIKECKKIGVTISDIFICPHGWKEACFCRKPQPGLFFQAASKHNINLFESYCIGDDLRDIMAGTSAGCKTIFIGNLTKSEVALGQKPDMIYKSLYEAVKHL